VIYFKNNSKTTDRHAFVIKQFKPHSTSTAWSNYFYLKMSSIEHERVYTLIHIN